MHVLRVPAEGEGARCGVRRVPTGGEAAQGGCTTEGGSEAGGCRWWRQKKERGEGEEKRERRGEMWLTSGPYRHEASMSAKPGTKTARWSKMNGFKGWMVKDIRFLSVAGTVNANHTT